MMSPETKSSRFDQRNDQMKRLVNTKKMSSFFWRGEGFVSWSSAEERKPKNAFDDGKQGGTAKTRPCI